MRQEGTPDTFIEHLLDAWSTHRYPSTPPTQPLGWGFSHYPVLQTGVSVAIGVEAGGPRTQHSTLMAPEMPVLTSGDPVLVCSGFQAWRGSIST